MQQLLTLDLTLETLYKYWQVSIYLPLFLIASYCTLRAFKTVVISIKRNIFRVEDHCFIVAIWLVSFWIGCETAYYGVGRVYPGLYPILSTYLPAVIAMKFIGLLGFCFAALGFKLADSDRSDKTTPFKIAAALWILAFVALIFSH